MRKDVFIAALVLLSLLCGCGENVSENMNDSDNLTEDVVISTLNDASEQKTETEVTTEEIQVDDYTKHGIWKHEVSTGSYEYFVLLEDGTGYNIYVKKTYDITWTYNESHNMFNIEFVGYPPGSNYTVTEENNLVTMKDMNSSFVFFYVGNDKDEEKQMIDDALELSGNGTEQVDGASIVKQNGVEEKKYDTPIIMLDDEYVKIELNSVFVERDGSDNIINAGIDYNVINKSEEHNIWVIIYDEYIGDYAVKLNNSPMNHTFRNPLRPSKRCDGNRYYGDVSTVTSIDDMEEYSFSIQVYVNDRLDSYGGGDYSYISSGGFPKE